MFDRDHEEESIPDGFTATVLGWCVRPRCGNGMPPIENTTRMSNGGGIGMCLAMTKKEWYQFRLRHGDHTRDRHLRIETGSGPTVRKIHEHDENEGGIGFWVNKYLHHRRPEGIGMGWLPSLTTAVANEYDGGGTQVSPECAIERSVSAVNGWRGSRVRTATEGI